MYQKYIKRFLDILFAIVLGLLTLPIIIIVAIQIKLESEGPILFIQDRSGRGGKTFRLLKFRSMAAHNNVNDKNSENQYTRIGKLLRKYSLDELPQLINVIKGDMSFIGPRPWIPEYFKHMNEYQRQRYNVLPGITGLAQTKGRNSIHIFEKIEHDIEFIKNITFKQDIKITIATFKTIFDKEVQEIQKSAIHNELEELIRQHYDKAYVTND